MFEKEINLHQPIWAQALASAKTIHTHFYLAVPDYSKVVIINTRSKDRLSVCLKDPNGILKGLFVNVELESESSDREVLCVYKHQADGEREWLMRAKYNPYAKK